MQFLFAVFDCSALLIDFFDPGSSLDHASVSMLLSFDRRSDLRMGAALRVHNDSNDHLQPVC